MFASVGDSIVVDVERGCMVMGRGSLREKDVKFMPRMACEKRPPMTWKRLTLKP
jgi:hypothetical protein